MHIPSSRVVDDDVADVLKARDGDAHAFSAVVHRHSRRAYLIARAIVDNHEDADDAVQDAWLRVWRSWDQFDVSTHFAPWLWRIVANAARDIRRRRVVRRVDPLPDDIPDATRAPDEQVAFRHGLARAMAGLSPRRKEIFVLHDVYGVEHQEIADTLDMRVGTVRAELFYARQHLRTALADWRSGRGGVTSHGDQVSHV